MTTFSLMTLAAVALCGVSAALGFVLLGRAAVAELRRERSWLPPIWNAARRCRDARCRTGNPPHARYCRACGRALHAGAGGSSEHEQRA